MLGWLIIIAASVLMYRVAEMSDHRGIIWGPATFVVCLLCALFIPLPFINYLIGLGLSYGAMVLISVLKK